MVAKFLFVKRARHTLLAQLRRAIQTRAQKSTGIQARDKRKGSEVFLFWSDSCLHPWMRQHRKEQPVHGEER